MPTGRGKWAVPAGSQPGVGSGPEAADSHSKRPRLPLPDEQGQLGRPLEWASLHLENVFAL